MLIKPINIALFSINISFQIVLGKPLLRIIFMKIIRKRVFIEV